MWKIVFIFLIGTVNFAVRAQVKVFVDSAPVKELMQQSPDSIKFLSNRVLNSYWKMGYIFAGLDSIVDGEGAKKIYLHKGEKVRIKIERINTIGASSSFESYKKNKALAEVLDELINAGYPFASLQWDSLYADAKSKLHGTLTINPGPYIVNDTLQLLSSIKTDELFIQRTLDLRVGDPFNEKKFQTIPKRMRRISFLQLKAQPDIGFSGGEAEVFLDIEERPASSFEGVIGFLPNQANNNKLLITGFLDLQLDNLFSSGRALSFTWQKFAYQSQQLDIEYHHPYLFNSRLLVDAGFKLTKQDTTFINREFELGIGTFIGDQLIFEGRYTRFSGDVLTKDMRTIESQVFADYQTDLYSLGISNPSFNKDFEFGSFWSYQLQMTAGKKNIFKNPALPPAYFDTIKSVSTVLKFRLASKWQQILFNRTAFYHELNLGGIDNDEILKNELFRQGGLNSLRGFNEQFFFVQYFLLNRFELRQYFEQRSYFMVFYDQMFYQLFGKNDAPMGLGLGFSLATSNGLFNFAFAAGRSSHVPFDFTNSKVHLGYISLF